VASNFFKNSSWDECPTNLWTLPTFSELANMTREDLNSPVAAAATAQVKLCPYDKEEPHIWFCLIEAQFAAAGIKSHEDDMLRFCLRSLHIFCWTASAAVTERHRQEIVFKKGKLASSQADPALLLILDPDRHLT
jgi:hypothetical protein